jgi:hypothetical protein
MWPDWLDNAVSVISNTAKAAYIGLTQRFQTEPARGSTVTGIRDTKAGRISNTTNKRVGEWVIRVDNAHSGAPAPHKYKSKYQAFQTHTLLSLLQH